MARPMMAGWLMDKPPCTMAVPNEWWGGSNKQKALHALTNG